MRETHGYGARNFLSFLGMERNLKVDFKNIAFLLYWIFKSVFTIASMSGTWKFQ